MKIEIGSLAACGVSSGGNIVLGLKDSAGAPVELRISPEDAHSIAMTLPNLLDSSLRQRYRDDSLRYAVPLEVWKVEASSDGSEVIMTFTAMGGFAVSFATRAEMCRTLALALSGSTEGRARQALPLKN